LIGALAQAPTAKKVSPLKVSRAAQREQAASFGERIRKVSIAEEEEPWEKAVEEKAVEEVEMTPRRRRGSPVHDEVEEGKRIRSASIAEEEEEVEVKEVEEEQVEVTGELTRRRRRGTPVHDEGAGAGAGAGASGRKPPRTPVRDEEVRAGVSTADSGAINSEGLISFESKAQVQTLMEQLKLGEELIFSPYLSSKVRLIIQRTHTDGSHVIHTQGAQNGTRNGRLSGGA
jgi:hypothetical protein